MMRRKRLLAVFFIAVIFTGQLSCFKRMVLAQSYPSVILDGRLLSFSVQPRIINDRVMVPYRAIGEAMGATVIWEEATRKVTMLLNDRYVILYTGNTMMLYGTHSLNSVGELVYNNPITTTLDAPPIIIEDYSFVPLRAITEGLGAFVSWNDSIKSVVISSPPSPTSVPIYQPGQTGQIGYYSPSPSPTPPLDIFDQTSWYQTISGKRAQAMYDNNEQFILLYFSGDDPTVYQYLPELKQTAKNFGYKIYAVDARFEPIGAADLTFIWNHHRMFSIVYPLVFFVNGVNDVTYLAGPTDKQTLDTWFDTYIYKSRFAPSAATTSPGTGVVTPTPRPSASPEPDLNEFWMEIVRSTAITMYNTDQKFILVYYHSADDDSKRWLNTVKSATLQAGYAVYGCNAYNIDESTWWWGKNYVTNSSFTLYPTIFFVNRRQVEVMEQPTNVDEIVSRIRSFIAAQ